MVSRGQPISGRHSRSGKASNRLFRHAWRVPGGVRHVCSGDRVANFHGLTWPGGCSGVCPVGYPGRRPTRTFSCCLSHEARARLLPPRVPGRGARLSTARPGSREPVRLDHPRCRWGGPAGSSGVPPWTSSVNSCAACRCPWPCPRDPPRANPRCSYALSPSPVRGYHATRKSPRTFTRIVSRLESFA
jgi:hypothetical protein